MIRKVHGFMVKLIQCPEVEDELIHSVKSVKFNSFVVSWVRG